MKTAKFLLISALCASQAQAFTLPRQAVKSYDCDVCAQLSHENLQDKWEITNQTLDQKVSNLQKSYGYRVLVTMEDLRNGLTLNTLAPGAVVRITPLQDKVLPTIKLKTPSNQLLSLKEASALFSEDEALSEKLMSTKHQTMLQIKPALGAGPFVLKGSSKTGNKADKFLVSVLDKFSATSISVETENLHYQYGDKITALITLNDDDGSTIDDIEAAIISPQGQSIPLNLSKVGYNRYKGTTNLLSEVNDHGENWYVEASLKAENNIHVVQRSGHSAFSYSVPSASLIAVKKIASKPLTFVATIDVATPSRYALQSVLFRRSSSGETKPIETSQKAQWLDSGKQVIQFTFDNSHQFTEDTLYLGYLRLIDYGQLKTVHQFNQPIKLSQLVD